MAFDEDLSVFFAGLDALSAQLQGSDSTLTGYLDGASTDFFLDVSETADERYTFTTPVFSGWRGCVGKTLHIDTTDYTIIHLHEEAGLLRVHLTID